jgi:2-polyprenyl-3-methyl-5-hydroxy-6-metoxy-1,4-benzoquinol methylase
MSATIAPPSPDLFFETTQAHQRTAALRSAIELELFTAIGDSAHTVAEIAARCHASERGTRMLCDYLTIVGFLSKTGETYQLTPDSAMFLSKRSPAYLGGTMEFLGSPELVHMFDDLTATIRRGTITEQTNTVSADNPVWQKFARAMAPMMIPSAQAIADVLSAASAGPIRVLDIAAGHGVFGIAIAQRNAQAEIVAVDWEGVLEVATENANRMGVAARHRALPGDAFKIDWGTGYDVALVTNFLHHFDPPTCEGLLRKIAGTLNPGGRVAVLEFVPNDDRISPPMPASFVMNMLAGTAGGNAYTFKELREMLVASGFSDVTQHPLMGMPQTVIVGVK